MSRRNKAIHLMKMFRDELADALTEAVLDNDEWRNIDGYSTGDEKVMELGDRLWRLNQMIHAMPAETELTPADTTFIQPTGKPHLDLSTFVIQQGVPLPTWDDFVRAVANENRNQASKILATLARIDPQLAFQATNVFAAQYVLYPEEFRGKAMSLRAQLAAGAPGSVRLIYELFGIVGPKADQMYQSLRTTI